jgi:hypothetical protein
MAWNERSWIWPDWNGLESKKSILAFLELLGMEEVSLGLTGIAWNRGAWYGPE